MLSKTYQKLRCLNVGDNVLIPMSEFDMERGDPLNTIGTVLEKKENGSVKVGTKEGVIQGWLSIPQVEFAKQTLLKAEDVPSTEMTIRRAVRVLSVGTGQGFKRCQSKGACLTKQCSCFKEGNLCIGSCHPRSNCKNKECPNDAKINLLHTNNINNARGKVIHLLINGTDYRKK